MKLLGHQRKASAGHGIARGVLAWGWWHVYPSRGEGVNQRTMGGKQDTRRGRRGGVSPRDPHASAVIGGAPRPPPLRPRRGVCEPAQATGARRSGRRQQAASVQGDVPQARGRPARARPMCLTRRAPPALVDVRRPASTPGRPGVGTACRAAGAPGSRAGGTARAVAPRPSGP